MNQKKVERAKHFQQQNNSQQQNQHHDQQQHQSQQEFYHDVHTYLEWQAPGRPFKARSREFFVNALLITLALEIILFLFSQYFLMVVIIALIFLAFALSSVPPREFSYKVSSEGILVENEFFIWDELYDFYFIKHHGLDALHVRTKAYLPGELTITLGEISTNQIKSVFLQFLPFREHVELGFMVKAGNWLEHNFPLEKSAR